MKTTILSLFLLSSIHLFAWEFVRDDGTKFTQDQVSEVAPDGLVFTTNTGIEKVKVKDLPQEVVELYAFNAEADSSEVIALKNELKKVREENAGLKAQIEQLTAAQAKPEPQAASPVQPLPLPATKPQGEVLEVTDREKVYVYQKATWFLSKSDRYSGNIVSKSSKDESVYKKNPDGSVDVTIDLVVWKNILGKREKFPEKYNIRIK